MAESSFLLKVADDTVLLLQSLVTVLNDYYEANVKEMSSHSAYSLSGPNLEAVQRACHELSEYLASLWPCERQFVAVFGHTGCGKSTLLNVLLSMMCSTAETYKQGIKADSSRAVLRETARIHSQPVRERMDNTPRETEGDLSQSACSEDSKVSDSSRESHGNLRELSDGNNIARDLLENERLSIGGVLGICCARNRDAYMRKHISQYDNYPFLLQNGRMGGAGTTKVTAIEYGPKFVGHVRWTPIKKLRRKLRDLRHLLENQARSTDEEQLLAELKEFWQCVRQLVDIPSHIVQPDEEQIERVIAILGNRRQVGRDDVIETVFSKGDTIDRIFVRQGIKDKLCHPLGKLAEDVRIQVPVSSFEGGIGLLDVPGTNDPRVLHQRETRDAIDRTSLILLVLDKSVMDNQTVDLLVDSPLLERMLMDETAQCSLVAVGIAEKGNGRSLPPKELVDGFDPKNEIRNSLRKVFTRIASRLHKNRRITKEDAFQRIQSLFSGSDRISVIPVLPFMCASIHLSASNPALHKLYCESKNQPSCPLIMSKEKRMEKCMETNIPRLLERVHSVRLPPPAKDLSLRLKSAIELLKPLTQQSVIDPSYVDFLRRERDQAKSVVPDFICLDKLPDNNVNEQFIDDVLGSCAKESMLLPEDIEYIKDNLINKGGGKRLSAHLQTGCFQLGPLMVRGFRPEMIGQRAQELIKSVDNQSSEFIDLAFEHIFACRGDASRIDASVDKVVDVCMAVGLYNQLEERWKLCLQRLRAKSFCGGIDGGLLGQVRVGLRKAYDGSIKHFFRNIKQQRTEESMRETLCQFLSENKIGIRAAEIAKKEVKDAINKFWENLLTLTNREIQFLWKAWQDDIDKLADGANKALRFQLEASEDSVETEFRRNISRYDDKLKIFQETLKEKNQGLDRLLQQLDEQVDTNEPGFHYGYSLLQKNPQFCSCLVDGNIPAAEEPMPPITPTIDLAFEVSERVVPGVDVNFEGHGGNTIVPEDQALFRHDQQRQEDQHREVHDRDGSLNFEGTSLADQNNHWQDVQFISSMDVIQRRGDGGSSPRSPKLKKPSYFGRPHSKDVMRIEVESRNLQKRETDRVVAGEEASFQGHSRNIVVPGDEALFRHGQQNQNDQPREVHDGNLSIGETVLVDQNKHGQDGQLVSPRDGIMRRGDHASGSLSPKFNRLGSFGEPRSKPHRRAVKLTEAESLNLQKRETNPIKKAKK